MNQSNWCIKCGRRIDAGVKTCHHCGATQKFKNTFNMGDPSDIQVVACRYDHLVFKAATEKLTTDEEREIVQLGEYLRNNK